MAIITLTTDLGQIDAYVGSVKGKLLTKCPSATLVDISHQIPRFNIFHAAYVLQNAFPDFPEGTIHVIGVESTEAEDIRAVAIRYQGQYFIGFDNGLLSLVCQGQPDEMVTLDARHLDHQTFLLRDLLAEAACELANGKPLAQLGRPVQALVEAHTQEPVLVDGSIRGNVVYIDHYGNAITNISEQLFRERGEGARFPAQLQAQRGTDPYQPGLQRSAGG